MPQIGELDTDEQLGGSNCGDHDVILVSHQLIDRDRRAFSRDQERRVKDQALQRRSSGSNPARSSARSAGQLSSTG